MEMTIPKNVLTCGIRLPRLGPSRAAEGCRDPLYRHLPGAYAVRSSRSTRRAAPPPRPSRPSAACSSPSTPSPAATRWAWAGPSGSPSTASTRAAAPAPSAPTPPWTPCAPTWPLAPAPSASATSPPLPAPAPAPGATSRPCARRAGGRRTNDLAFGPKDGRRTMNGLPASEPQPSGGGTEPKRRDQRGCRFSAPGQLHRSAVVRPACRPRCPSA